MYFVFKLMSPEIDIGNETIPCVTESESKICVGAPNTFTLVLHGRDMFLFIDKTSHAATVTHVSEADIRFSHLA